MTADQLLTHRDAQICTCAGAEPLNRRGRGPRRKVRGISHLSGVLFHVEDTSKLGGEIADETQPVGAVTGNLRTPPTGGTAEWR